MTMDVPTLIIAFNRPENVQALVDKLVGVEATKVYAVVDGPRVGNTFDEAACAEVRSIIDSAPWANPPITDYREVNMGCRDGVSSAIDWFFSQEPEGIILEDDCIPNDSFFPYCQDLLKRYRNDNRVGVITGCTYFPLIPNSGASYTFSRYPHIWGWATWRRAWNSYEGNLGASKANIPRVLESVSGGSKSFTRHWGALLDQVDRRELDSWAYVWNFSLWKKGLLSISPHTNMITNVGFQPGATHTSRAPLGKSFRPKAKSIAFPLNHPEMLEANEGLERLYRNLGMYPYGKQVRSLLRIVWAISPKKMILRHFLG